MPAPCPPSRLQHAKLPTQWPARLAFGFGRLVLYNTVIATFLTLLWEYDFTTNFIYAQCIGGGIAFTHSLLVVHRKGQGPRGRDALLAIPLGFLSGFSLASWLTGLHPGELLRQHPQAVLGSAATALIFGSVAAYYFSSLTRLDKANREIQKERMQRLAREKAAAQAELAVLQAQIEPHFLFNTLGAATGLIDQSPQAAKAMLLDLTTLLRGTLLRTREHWHTLDEELALVRAYLDIMARRMGPRLCYDIESEAGLGSLPLPPLLLQPIVENAIRHGLEPLESGGRLTLRLHRVADSLHITLSDTGQGWSAQAAASPGIGLQNLRARLEAAYGPAAQLALYPNPLSEGRSGLTVSLHLPLTPIPPEPACNKESAPCAS